MLAACVGLMMLTIDLNNQLQRQATEIDGGKGGNGNDAFIAHQSQSRVRLPRPIATLSRGVVHLCAKRRRFQL
jgi:hypothetical protein